MSLFLEHV
jgi:zinc transporter 1/2/3